MRCDHTWKCADDAPWCSHEKNVRVCASGKVFCVQGTKGEGRKSTVHEVRTKEQGVRSG